MHRHFLNTNGAGALGVRIALLKSFRIALDFSGRFYRGGENAVR